VVDRNRARPRGGAAGETSFSFASAFVDGAFGVDGFLLRSRRRDFIARSRTSLMVMFFEVAEPGLKNVP